MPSLTEKPSGPQLPVFDSLSQTFVGGPPVRLAAPAALPAFVHGMLPSPVGPIPRVTARRTWSDRLGAIKARWNVGRMDFKVLPGLYALGDPAPDGPILVSANYRMSFDVLRAALPGRSAWILVLDTGGVNVWCAAGKGTFGTEALLRSIQSCGLSRVASGRTLILPQLAAPGVAAHRIERASGFRVVFGPVRAADLPAFLDAGLRAAPGMRRVRFDLRDRAAVVPVALVQAVRWTLPLALVAFFLAGLGWSGDWARATLAHGGLAMLLLLLATLAGAVIAPLLLPYLPGLSFYSKGMVAYGLLCGATARLWWPAEPGWATGLELLALASLGLAEAAYLAMNFTGSSTYTSLSGVRREMRVAVPVQLALVVLGLLFWALARLAA